MNGTLNIGKVSADAAQSSAKIVAGKILIPLSAVLVVVDGVTLGFTIKDLIEKPEHKISKDLREKAKFLQENLDKFRE